MNEPSVAEAVAELHHDGRVDTAVFFGAQSSKAFGVSAERAPLMARNVYVAAKAVRLLPSKGMVWSQALPESGRFLHQIGVVARLWAIERRLQQSRIAQPRRPAIALDLIGMHGQDFGEREVIAHFASFW